MSSKVLHFSLVLVLLFASSAPIQALDPLPPAVPASPYGDPIERIQPNVTTSLAAYRSYPRVALQARPILRYEPHEFARHTPLDPIPPLESDKRYYLKDRSESFGSDQSRSITGTCTVTTTADSGPGSLRQCLLEVSAGATISFDVAVFPPTAPMTISLASALPWIEVDDLTIDGSNAGVILDGSGLRSGNGLVVLAARGVRLRGLWILRFPERGLVLAHGARNTVIGGDPMLGTALLGQGNLISYNGLCGVQLQNVGTTDNYIIGNRIGTDATGANAMGNGAGIVIGWGASNNIVGGEDQGNLVSGNHEEGIWIQDPTTTNNEILGNRIGTDAMGLMAVSNQRDGVFVGFGAYGTVIGGDSTSAGNLISGNIGMGLRLQTASGSQVLGNRIGTDNTGSQGIGNMEIGILVSSGSSGNFIGGEGARFRNVISGNGEDGICLEGYGTQSNHIVGNYIGLDITGSHVLGNGGDGVVIAANSNIIGAGTPETRNIIAGNRWHGVDIQGATVSGNLLQGNYIGTDAEGRISLGNLLAGIYVGYGAVTNSIGGEVGSTGNLVSGNSLHGIILDGTDTRDNYVTGNFIGTDWKGTTALGNGDVGVLISGGARCAYNA